MSKDAVETISNTVEKENYNNGPSPGSQGGLCPEIVKYDDTSKLYKYVFIIMGMFSSIFYNIFGI